MNYRSLKVMARKSALAFDRNDMQRLAVFFVTGQRLSEEDLT